MITSIFKRIGLLLAIVVALAACGSAAPYTFQGGTIDQTMLAPDFALQDQNGSTFRLSEQVGKVVLVFFGFTHCPDFCPTTMSDFKAVKQQLGADAERVRFVMITVDPERDTTAVVRQYLTAFDPTFTGLVPTAEQLPKLLSDYNINVEKDAPDANGNYNVGHSSLTYAIDRTGQLRLAYPMGMGSAMMLPDVKYLLRGR